MRQLRFFVIPHARLRPGILLLLLVWLGGCAAPQTRQLLDAAPQLPRARELTAVPFFPQEEYQCGPAALATVFNDAGIGITPEQLAPQIYLPKRQGSLQFELLAASRRQGLLPYQIRPRLDALFAEVAAGHPVLVLQNLGLTALPFWHYAVVVGFDLESASVVLRSGTIERHITSFQTFERTWGRGGFWGVVVLPPDQLPQTAEEQPYLEAVVMLERLQRWPQAATAYAAALQRWPQSLGAAMGLGNSLYAEGDLPAAEAAFRLATERHQESGSAFNNLAQTLADQKRWEEARIAAQRAVGIGGGNVELFRQTLEQIERHP